MAIHTKYLLIVVLALFVILSVTNADDTISSPRRATETVRNDYITSAAQRYAKRLSSRADHAAQLSTFHETSPSIVSQYRSKRRATLTEQYITGEDKSLLKNNTPRANYLLKWDKLSPGEKASLQPKRDALMSLYGSSQDWIPMTTPDFAKFALNGARPYWLWITFTALDKTFHCPTCTTYHKYWQAVTPKLQRDALQAYAAGTEPLPLVMAIIQPTQAREVWRALNLNRAPVSILLPPEFDDSTKIKIQDVLSAGVLRQTLMMNPNLEDLVNPLAKNGFDASLPPMPPPSVIMLSFVFAVIAGLVVALYMAFPHLLKLQNYRGPFIIIAVLIFLYALSGGGYNKSNSPPMTSHKNGAEIWVSREYSQQLGAELFVVLALHLFTALGLFVSVTAFIPYGLSQAVARVTTPVDYAYRNTFDTSTPIEASTVTDTKKVPTPTVPASGTYHVTELDKSIRFERRVSYLLARFIPSDFIFVIGFAVWIVGYYALLKTFQVKMPSYPFAL